jgi:hypothetical protein
LRITTFTEKIRVPPPGYENRSCRKVGTGSNVWEKMLWISEYTNETMKGQDEGREISTFPQGLAILMRARTDGPVDQVLILLIKLEQTAHPM